jgi:ubiquinone/menaquinone biosynthesis C-methylase UbiE
VENAGTLDNVIRRWIQNPKKILTPYITPGMSVMDYGCGPGFFTIDMAQMVGSSGQVIAVDLQEGMLRKVEGKIRNTELEKRIRLHQCKDSSIGLSETVDFVLAFYVVHEVPEQEKFYTEVKSILRPNGSVLLVEPPFHVSKKTFQESLKKAQDVGFDIIKGPHILLSKAALLKT